MMVVLKCVLAYGFVGVILGYMFLSMARGAKMHGDIDDQT